ncbi:MAG: hypothetical protein KAS39_08360, partial [Actinomycetia bacterium]|nr:hypothetical protein [Actinomycetes bacterium]
DHLKNCAKCRKEIERFAATAADISTLFNAVKNIEYNGENVNLFPKKEDEVSRLFNFNQLKFRLAAAALLLIFSAALVNRIYTNMNNSDKISERYSFTIPEESLNKATFSSISMEGKELFSEDTDDEIVMIVETSIIDELESENYDLVNSLTDNVSFYNYSNEQKNDLLFQLYNNIYDHFLNSSLLTSENNKYKKIIPEHYYIVEEMAKKKTDIYFSYIKENLITDIYKI